MSGPPERPWTEEEKYALFTEILKKAEVPSAYLYNIIRDFRISPRWGDIPLPSGRSLNSCQVAFENMRQQSVAPGQPLPPPWFPAGPPPEPPISRKRPLPPDRPPLPRAIQPKTGQFGGEARSPSHIPPSLEGLAPRQGEPPRKRGRPSKAETERRKQAAEARGESYPPQRRPLAAKPKSPLMRPGRIGAAGTATVGERPQILPRTTMHPPEMQRQEGPAPDAPIQRNDRETEPQVSLPPITDGRAMKAAPVLPAPLAMTPPYAGPQLFPRPRESKLVSEESTFRPVPEELAPAPQKAEKVAEAPARGETDPSSNVGTRPSHDQPSSSPPERTSHTGAGEASISPMPGSGPAKT